MLVGTALVGTDRLEARATLDVIEAWAPERLRAIADELRGYLAVDARAMDDGATAAQSPTAGRDERHGVPGPDSPSGWEGW